MQTRALLSTPLRAGKAVAVLVEDGVFGGATHIAPAPTLKLLKHLSPIEFTIPQQDHLGIGWDQRLDLAQEFQMPGLATVSLAALEHDPTNRQCSISVHDTDHQTLAASPNRTRVNDQHQRLGG